MRGLRAYSDFEYEFRMALINRKLSGIETCFLMADEAHSHVSSSLIRELARWKMTLPDFVVCRELLQRARLRRRAFRLLVLFHARDRPARPLLLQPDSISGSLH
ncbi:MAG: hypothetical protein EOO41_05040, partial [Methanobacteriota archaeon]